MRYVIHSMIPILGLFLMIMVPVAWANNIGAWVVGLYVGFGIIKVIEKIDDIKSD